MKATKGSNPLLSAKTLLGSRDATLAPMRRARFVFRCAAFVTALTSFAAALVTSSATLGGCGSSAGDAPGPGNDAASDTEVAPPPGDGAVVDAPGSDAASRPTLTPIYARGYGSAGDAGGPVTVTPTGLAVDPNGGVIVAGTYNGGPIDLGNHTLPAPSGSTDAFLVQLDVAGAHLQSKAFGDQATQTGGEVVGSAAKLYASFDFAGTIPFPNDPISSSGDGSNANSVTARFGSQLEFSGLYGFASSAALHIVHLALGAASSVIVFGDWTSSLKPQSFASSQTRNPLHPGLVVARVLADTGAAADIAHTDYCPDESSCHGNAIAADVNGEALVGGRFAGSIGGFDGGAAVTATADEDAYLIKLDAQLNPQWLASFGGSGVQDVTAIAAVPKTSDFVVAGVFQGTFTPPGKMPVVAVDSGSDVFVMRVGPTGSVIWAETFGGHGDDVVRGIAVDPDANVFLVGDFYGPGLTFGGGPLVNSDSQGRGTRDMFLAWLDGNGNHVFSSAYGTPGDESPVAVGVDAMGNVVVTGSFDEGIDFGAGIVRAAGASDMFVARLAR